MAANFAKLPELLLPIWALLAALSALFLVSYWRAGGAESSALAKG